MYTDPCPPRGLGQYATGYTIADGGTGHPCEDFMFKLMNKESCARMGYNGTPTPAEQKGTVYEPPPAAPVPTESSTIVFPTPLEQITQVFEVEGGGGGGGGPAQTSIVYELTPGALDPGAPAPSSLAIDADESRGFGLVEAAIAAGLALLLARSYQQRR